MRKVAFVCSEPWISGGFHVIFRHAMELARGGITVAIVCKTPVTAAHVGWHPIAEMADHPNLLWLDHNEALSHRFDLGRFRLAPFEICAEYNGFEHLLDPFRGDHA